MKLLTALFLFSTSALATEVCETTSSGKYCENAAINQITIENDVEVYSSRQNVWVCGVGIKNVNGSNTGSDNRVYYTRTKYEKGRDEVISTENKVMEPSDTNQWLSQDRSGFNDQVEYRFSNIRAELASLNYGAELYVDICGDLPFAYFDMPSDTRRNFLLELTATQKYFDLASLGTSVNEYAQAAGLQWRIDGGAYVYHGTGQLSEDQNFWDYGNSVLSGNGYGRIGWLTRFQDAEDLSVPYADLVSSSSSSTAIQVFDTNAGDRGNYDGSSSFDADITNWTIRFRLKETASGSRLKGLTEGLKWQQNIKSELDIRN